jgi:hypothetical protein
LSPLDPEIPPVGEEIHLPGPTIQPALLAFGITLGLVGVTWTPIALWLGVALSIVVIVRWIREAARDIDQLPLEHK